MKFFTAMHPFSQHTSHCFSVISAGSYLYLDRDQLMPGVSELDTYRSMLVSRTLTYTQSADEGSARCFSFWYHMTGHGQESCVLRVRIAHGQETDSGTTVWSQNARYSNTWKRVAVDINALTPYQVCCIYI